MKKKKSNKQQNETPKPTTIPKIPAHLTPQTSLSSAYVMMRLAQNPEKQEKLQEELDRVLGNGEQVLSPHHIKELRYLKACVKEALRLEVISAWVK